jgi:glutamate-1-semialdehyde 2,1-aminomutase
VYVAPSMYEAGFVSMAHTEEDIDKTLEAINEVFSQL